MEDNSLNNDSNLRRSMLFAFSMPAVMLGFMHAPESSVQGIYAKFGGLSLTAIAGAMLFSRLFDAITYPLIGHLSDATFRKAGTRKAWIVAGTIVTVVGLWFLYRPPPNVTITYYTIWTIVTYVGWKLTEIPYGAWALGLSSDYVQRARVQLWRSMGMMFGSLIFYVVPFLSKAFGLSETTEMTMQTLGFTAVLIAVCVPLLNLYALATVPEGGSPSTKTESSAVGDWRGTLHAVTNNRPLLHLLIAFVPVTFLNGMSAGVTYLYADSYLGLAEQLPIILLLGVPFTLLGLPFWGWVCLKYERHHVWAVSLILASIAYAGMGFAPVGSAGFPFMVTLYPITCFCQIAVGVTVPAMMGDIMDHERLCTGEDRSGIYSAILAFVAKSMTGISAAIGLAVLGWLDFNAAAHSQTATGAFAIRLVAVWLPALGMACGAPLIWRFPINRARQAEIHEAIKVREAAALK